MAINKFFKVSPLRAIPCHRGLLSRTNWKYGVKSYLCYRSGYMAGKWAFCDRQTAGY